MSSSADSHSSENQVAIEATNLTKKYHLYAHPTDRLKHFFFKNKTSLSKSYQALDEVNISLLKGEVLGVIGENGAGKSTLLSLITGDRKSDEGDVNILPHTSVAISHNYIDLI